MSDDTPKLNMKQRVFVEHYLTCWNATEAARLTGYAHPNKQGPALLVNLGIQAQIAARMKAIAMSADEALARLTDHARASLSDFLTIQEEEVTVSKVVRESGDVVETTTTTMKQMVARLDLEKAKKAGKLHLVRKYANGPKGLMLELHDAQAAIKQIIALGKPVPGSTPGNPQFTVGMTLEEWEAKAQARLNAAEQTMAAFADDEGGADA